MTPTASPNPHPASDPVLSPFLSAPSPEAAKQQLEHLIRRHAAPVIWAQTRGESLDTASDIYAETIHRLLRRMQSDCHGPIADFYAYVKVTARSVRTDAARKANREKPFSAFTTKLDANDGGFFLADLVGGCECSSHSNRSGCYDCVETTVSRRHELRALWAEILILPTAQRHALLLSMRGVDGRCALPFLSVAGASPAQLAVALGVSRAQLDDLLPLLPLPDEAIGARLTLSETRVQGLRKAARKRLERRTRAWLCESP